MKAKLVLELDLTTPCKTDEKNRRIVEMASLGIREVDELQGDLTVSTQQSFPPYALLSLY